MFEHYNTSWKTDRLAPESILYLDKSLSWHGVLVGLTTPRYWECQEKKNVRLTLSMNLSSMTAPDYGKMCPNFCYREIQFNQSQAWTWSYLRASHCLWSNERPGICYLLIFPVPEVRTHLPIIRDCHGAQIHWWCQPDIFFLLVFSMTKRDL